MKSSEHLISHNEAKLSSITSPVTGISNFSLNSPVDGSYIIDDFITKQEEIELINSIDLHEWSGNGIPPNPEMRRRTQQYGYEFSYRYRKVVQNLGALPTFLDFIIARFVEQKIIQLSEMEYPNMCIVNEYQVGQGPRSLLIMTKSSRFDYKHSISKDAIEYYNGDEIIRDRRVSLTFRTIMTSKEEEKGVGTDCC